jgi:hypothetical protein
MYILTFFLSIFCFGTSIVRRFFPTYSLSSFSLSLFFTHTITNMKLHKHKEFMIHDTQKHTKKHTSFQRTYISSKTSQQVTNINVYQQQHYSISSYGTCGTCLSHIRQSRTVINSSVASKCVRSTQYHHRYLLSVSDKF